MTTSSDRTTDPGSKSSAEIEREVRQQRADVERTLDAIQERLSPGQLVDQAMTYLRDGGGSEFVHNLGESVKRNPVPVALIGVGVAWMMASGRRNGYPERDYWVEFERDYWAEDEFDELDELDPYATGGYATEPYEPVPGTVPGGLNEAGSNSSFEPASASWSSVDEADDGSGLGDRAKAAAASARDKADELRQRARDAATGARAGVGEMGARARDAAAGAGASVGEMGARARAGLARAGRNVSGRAQQTGAYARRYGRRAQRGLLETLDQQPLLLGAIGLAVGAAIGGALPSTDREDRLMGDTRDRLKRRATAAGREQVDKATAAAGAAYDAARDEAERQGLTAEGGRSAVEAARQKVEKVAEAASTAGKDEAERQGLGKASASSPPTTG